MPVELPQFVSELEPRRTLLLFGAGSSVPSGAPLAADIARHLASKFGLPTTGFTLAEIASLVEQKFDRRRLVAEVRAMLDRLKPTRGLLNLPLYDWRSVFTTNYDRLIEAVYKHHARALDVFASDFDFGGVDRQSATKLFKLHGDIDADVSDGHRARLILTETDYDHTLEYRESLYDRLRADLAGSHLVIIGHSLADPDIKAIADKAANLATKVGSGRISLMQYQRDGNRAALYEARNIAVCFAGIDELFAELAKKPSQSSGVQSPSEASLDVAPSVRPTTTDVSHACGLAPRIDQMFNGWPAAYADVSSGFTFERVVATNIVTWIASSEALCAVLLGAAGVGKTTASRQCLVKLKSMGYECYEHQHPHAFDPDAWRAIAAHLSASGKRAVLFVDEAHSHLQQVNQLLDHLGSGGNTNLRMLLVSAKNHWSPRMKSSYVFRLGREFRLGRLEPVEIDRLLRLVENKPEVRNLVETSFAGFSRGERRRRLEITCASETFVCLKCVFASEKFDDIVLREYQALHPDEQDVYRYVAAMEAAGVIVHRQFVMRMLGLDADVIAGLLQRLSDIVREQVISEREGVYAWRGRHVVIDAIISRYKFPAIVDRVALFDKILQHVNPTYGVELQTIRELCNFDYGVASIPDKEKQNQLFRRMISIAPGERVPRHKLIRNLIHTGQYDAASTEIRVFEQSFGLDGPIARNKIALVLARAISTDGIMDEDRLVILREARQLADTMAVRFPNHRGILREGVEVGLAIHARTGEFAVFDEALARLRRASEFTGDPEIDRMVGRYERRLRGGGEELEDSGNIEE